VITHQERGRIFVQEHVQNQKNSALARAIGAAIFMMERGSGMMKTETKR